LQKKELRMRQAVDLAHANRLINHGPTVLVSSQHEGRRNVMAAAWSMPVEFTPPRVAVVIDGGLLTLWRPGPQGDLTKRAPAALQILAIAVAMPAVCALLAPVW
jgi:hypothetical protein